jgi:hypothetical protein
MRSDEIIRTKFCSILGSAFLLYDRIDNVRRFGTKMTFRLMDRRQ